MMTGRFQSVVRVSSTAIHLISAGAASCIWLWQKQDLGLGKMAQDGARSVAVVAHGSAACSGAEAVVGLKVVLVQAAMANICSDFIATPTMRFAHALKFRKLKPWPHHNFFSFPHPCDCHPQL